MAAGRLVRTLSGPAWRIGLRNLSLRHERLAQARLELLLRIWLVWARVSSKCYDSKRQNCKDGRFCAASGKFWGRLDLRSWFFCCTHGALPFLSGLIVGLFRQIMINALAFLLT